MTTSTKIIKKNKTIIKTKKTTAKNNNNNNNNQVETRIHTEIDAVGTAEALKNAEKVL